VNATDSQEGQGEVGLAINEAAGMSLYDESLGLFDSDIGDSNLTSGHALPAKCKLMSYNQRVF